MSSRDAVSSRRALGATLAGTVAAFGGAVWAADPAPPQIIKPVWLQQPTLRNIVEVYPRDALNHGATGMVVIGCRVAMNGTLEACTVEEQSPAKYGFGEAGLKLSAYFRMEAEDEDGQRTAGAAVRIPIQFKLLG